MAPSHGLLDMTVYGRQEGWEDSPDGWPRVPAHFRLDGRPSRSDPGRLRAAPTTSAPADRAGL
jgi:hypothetical protein